MKFLIVGLGSMGKRRIRNLQYLKESDIIGFDLREDRRKEAEDKYKITTYSDINVAMEENPDALIISTPPNHHIEYEIFAAEHNKHFFCEAGIFTNGVEKLINICKGKDIIAAPSSTARFKESIKKIKELIDGNKIGKIVTFTYHMGQYLPDWHPWEDVSRFYVGQKETSATREMVPFEMEWLAWMFGDVKKISCMKGKISDLKVDIDDVYQLIFQYENNVIGHLLIDVISRDPLRELRIVGEKGTIEWSWMEDVVRLFDIDKKKWIEFKADKGFKEEGYVTKENSYIDEMNAFVKAIKGQGHFGYTLEEDYKILKLLEAAEKSSEKQIHMVI